MTPIERNARWLIGVMVRHFPNGATSEDLRRQYERDTSLVRQSFYNALSYVKRQGWFVRDEYDRKYHLNGDGSWKEPVVSIGDFGERLKKTQLEKVQLDNDRLEYLANSQTQQIEELQGEIERLRDWSNRGVNGVAVSNLAKIVGDNTASMRQRIKAAGAVLGYRVKDDSVVEFVRGFLESVCASADNIDYRIEAGELLRRHEAPRVMSESVRPTYPENEGSEASRIEAWRNYEIAARELKIIQETKDTPPPGWDDDLRADSYVPPAEGWPGPAPVIPLKDLVVARKARQNRLDRLEREAKEAEAQSRERSALKASQYNGNGSSEG